MFDALSPNSIVHFEMRLIGSLPSKIKQDLNTLFDVLLRPSAAAASRHGRHQHVQLLGGVAGAAGGLSRGTARAGGHAAGGGRGGGDVTPEPGQQQRRRHQQPAADLHLVPRHQSR